jgi:hypothetical protein
MPSCGVCQFSCKKNQSWTRHLLTVKHQIAVQNHAIQQHEVQKHEVQQADMERPGPSRMLQCFCCQYTCFKKSDFTKHFLTQKHQINSKRHEPQKAGQEAFKEGSQAAPQSMHLNEKLLLTLMQDNADFKRVLVDMHKHTSDLQQQMVQVCAAAAAAPMININHTTNKTFNLNFFLNEQCKNAMNISDFIASFQLQLPDLENVGKLGYVDGLAHIILARLKEMNIYDRPIHCTDARREVMHVKDNNIWEKDSGDEHSKIRKAVQVISKQNAQLLKCWRDTHPESNAMHSKENDQFLLLVVEALGGKGAKSKTENENKVMRQIAKHMAIEKN